jgi:hypothetical protein
MANNFPNILPTLNLDMVNGIYVDPRVTFTRAGTRTYYGQEVVKAEENLVLYSQEFDNAYWTKLNTTLTANSAAAPDGATTADLFYPSSTGVDRIVWRATSIGAAASTQYTISVYAKASGINFLYFGTFSGGTTAANLAFFDLGTGAVGQTGALFSSASITAVGDGWYRCVATATTATTAMNPLIGVSDASGNTTATASGTDGILIWQAQLEQRSFATAPTVTTTQPITRYQRQLKTAAANEWPREFDPVTGECLGRSVWESRTNLVLRSEEFDNASWTKTTGTVAANVLISPDGNLTADKLISGASSGAQRVVQSVTLVNGTAYTFSFYAKLAEYSRAAIVSSDGVTSRGIGFNLSTGATFSVGLTSPTTSSAVAIGNGWYRCSITYTAGGTSGNFQIYAVDNAGATTYTGDGTSGIYIWGADLQAGAFPTPYIKTEASQVTRLADSAVMTGANFSSWYRQDEGAFFMEAIPATATSNAASQNYMDANDATANNRIVMFRSGVSGLSAMNVVAGGTTYVSSLTSGAAMAQGAASKVSISYKVDDFAQSTNGATVGTDTSGVVSVVNRLSIGVTSTDTNRLNGYIKRLTYYPQALTAANLQAITR